MKKSLTLLTFSVVLLLSTTVGYAQSDNKLSTLDPRAREREFLEKRTFGGKAIEPDAYDRAMEQWRQLPRVLPGPGSISGLQPNAPTAVPGQLWRPFGPSPLQQGNNRFVNGRVNAIAINPSNPNMVYQGSAGGGLWLSLNAADPKNAANWTPLYDQQVSLGIGEPSSVAIDPTDTKTIYVGTSAESGQVRNITKGILKSTDGGGSWVVLGAGCDPATDPNCAQTALSLFAGVDINSIIVDPANPSTLYLASGIGLFTSPDAGQHWTKANTIGTIGTVNAESLVLDTTSPAANRILYAGVRSGLPGLPGQAAGGGILQSTDGGKNWTQVLTAATPQVATALNALMPNKGTGIGRVMIALDPPTTPANPAGIQFLYATIEGLINNNPSVLLGIFQTTNQGGGWNKRAAANLGNCFCFFGMVIGVDPASPGDGANDILYWGGITYHRSIDAGATFSNISNGLHADAHVLAFTKNSAGNTIVFTGNDGGIWRSDNNGVDWTGGGTGNAPPTINAGGLQTTLFYHMDVKRDATASVTLGSLQDNGISQTCSSLLPGTCNAPADWIDRTGADGIEVVFDAKNTSNAYGVVNTSATTEDVFQSTNSGGGNNGGTFNAIGVAQGIPQAELVAFNNQVSVDPNNAGFVYVGGSTTNTPTTKIAGRLFQNKNTGAFTPIWNFGVGNQPGEVDVASSNSNNVVVAVGGGVFISTNALSAAPTFSNITRNLPGRAVSEVAFDPNDPTVVYAVLSGFNSQTPGSPGHIFRTTLAGATWINISPPLDVPFNTIVLDPAPFPPTIYVGTDLGVIRSFDGTDWSTVDDIHLPNVPVSELKINSQAGALRASTFGRGVFDFVPATGPVISVSAENGLNFGTVCPGSTASLIVHVFNVGTANLTINSVQELFGAPSFSVLSSPPTPITLVPNQELDFTVQFSPAPGSPQNQNTSIRISSNDSGAPSFDLTATGTSSPPAIATVIADSGNFGNACVGSFVDLPLTINNNGGCTLSVTSITSSSSSPAFGTAKVVAFPLSIEGGGSLQVPIRFAPTIFGPQSGSISVKSNDQVNPTVSVSVTGNAPRPRETNTSCKFLAIDSGGSGSSPFLSDRDFSGGSSSSTSSSISTSGVILPAPQKVYQSIRFGSTFTYTFPGFTPSSNHAVRLHFAETRFTSTGKRSFNVFINGTQVLFGFDIVAQAGGGRKAIVEEFPATADTNGRIVIRFTKAVDNALINGIEIE
jgi:hypothetical protein